MKRTHHLVHSAPIAIAAMLALGSTHAVAQDASPTAPTVQIPPMVLPVDPVPDPETPSTSGPQVQFVPAPSVQTIPDPETAVDQREAAPPDAAATATATPVPRAETRQPTGAAAESRAPLASAANPAGDNLAGAQGTAPSGESAVPVREPFALPSAEPPTGAGEAADSAATSEWIALVALALLGLIPIGVAIMAMVWWRRRSRRVHDMRTAAPLTAGRIAVEARDEVSHRRPPIFEQEPASRTAAASIAAPDRRAPEPRPETAHDGGQGVAVLDRPSAAESRSRKPLPTSAFLPQDDKVILPDTVPQTYEERDRLLRGLVAQQPDAANPFRSPKARARRARLIIQSLGRKFDTARPRFDLSQYSYRWPHLARG